MPRLFIAVRLPALVQEDLGALATDIPGARWVVPHQLHVTVRFLGALGDGQVAALRQTLGRAAAPAFRLGVAGVGIFPAGAGRRKPARVLWAGLDPVEPVRALKAAIDAALGPDPEEAGRTFSPHVTLARFREPPPPEPLAEFLARHRTLASAAFAVDGFALFESRTLPTGSVYSLVAAYPLRR